MSFPQDEVLVALLRGPKKGMTVAELRAATGRAGSTVRNNLDGMARYTVGRRPDPWVTKVHLQGEGATRFVLTDKGREIARYRARRA